MKVKHTFLAFVALALATTAQAQVKVGANPASISTTAVLDVEDNSGSHSVILQNGNMGVGTATPQNRLHVNGTTQIAGPLQTGGSAATAGNAGTIGQVLISQGASSAPIWSTLGSTGRSGTVSGVYQAIGGGVVVVNQNGASSTDLGTSVSVTLSATSDIVVTYSGVPNALNSAQAFQGTLELMLDGTKVNSVYYGSSGSYYSGSSGSSLTLDIQPGAATIATTYLIQNVSAGTHTLSLSGRSIYHGTFWNPSIILVGNANPTLQVEDSVAGKCKLTAVVISE